MRILHFIDSLDYGGAETLLMSYLPLLDNYEHVVVTLRGPNSFKKSNYEYIELNIKPTTGFFKAVFAIRKIISDRRINIVHSHSFWTNIISRVATPGNIKLINHYHFADYDTMKHKSSAKRMILMDKIINRKSLIRVAVSEYVARILNDTFPKTIIKVIPNFIDYTPPPVAINTPVSSGVLRVIAVGNCNLEKNYALVLQAFEALKEEPVSIDIFGGGRRLDYYRDEVKRLGLNKVRFCGSFPNVRENMINYDLFLSASISETFGIAVLEGIGAKLPLLISDIPAFNEIAPKSVLFFNPYDKNDLANNLKKLINKNISIDYADYERVLKKYSTSIFVSKLKMLYRLSQLTLYVIIYA